MHNTLRTYPRVVAIAAGLILAASEGLAGDVKPAAATPNTTNRFAITGMHCDGCARGLAFELEAAPGVASAKVSFTNTLAVVAYDTNRTSIAKLIKVVKESGFKARKLSP